MITEQQVHDGVRVLVNNPDVREPQEDPFNGHVGTIRPDTDAQVYDASMHSAWVVFDSPVVYNNGEDTTITACWMYLRDLDIIS